MNPSPRSGVTETVVRCPPRITTACTFRPSGVSWTRRLNCRTLRTCSPSNSTITSPAFRPAFSAGLSFATSSITTPDVAFDASSVAESWTVTPICVPRPMS